MNAVAAIDVRQHILDTALPLFMRKGFTAVGLSELLSEAQVPKGSFYHYFASKEAFGEAVLDAYFAGYAARTAPLLAPPGTAAQRLIAYFEDWQDGQVRPDGHGNCLVVKLAAEVCDLSESMRAALERGTRDTIARIARCLDTGIAEGSLQPCGDTQALAATLYQHWLGAGLLAKIARDRAPLDAAMAETRHLLGLTASG